MAQTKPVFDPAKRYGEIFGQSSLYPNARYSQDGYIFDSNHKCLNPPEVKATNDNGGKVDIPPPPMSEADAKLFKRLSGTLKTAAEKLKNADEVYSLNETSQKKAALTRARKAYEAAKAEVEEFEAARA